MNSVLKEILGSKQVSDGKEVLELTSAMDEREGALLAKVINHVRPASSLEVGLAYGVSTLFICEALAKLDMPVRHIAIDPFQFSQWRGIGIRNIELAGYRHLVELREELSEIALPKLLSERTVLDLALIDGWHTFDHALVDFFYINKMLRVGGVLVLDDSWMPAIGKLIDHVLTYRCYRIFAVPSDHGALGWRMAYYAGLKRAKWPSAIALEKIAEDDRSWDWYKPF